MLKVLAEDRGIKSKTATATVTIQLLDVNDNMPKFPQNEYSVNVSENIPPKQPFFSSALATDPDNGDNGTVTYHLAAGQGKLKIYILNMKSQALLLKLKEAFIF